MTENSKELGVVGLESKFARVALTIVSVLLLFAGPTYVPYLLIDVLGVEHFVSIGLGLVLFVVGFVLLVFLIRKKVVA